jgi:hypothetical protein
MLNESKNSFELENFMMTTIFFYLYTFLALNVNEENKFEELQRCKHVLGCFVVH